MFEQAFKNIDAAIWKDTGCDSELDYAEQSSWILFLKWLDDFEKDEETKAKLDNKKFNLPRPSDPARPLPCRASGTGWLVFLAGP